MYYKQKYLKITAKAFLKISRKPNITIIRDLAVVFYKISFSR